jgi:hypothetical protein
MEKWGAPGGREAGDPGDLAVPQAQHVDRAQPEPLAGCPLAAIDTSRYGVLIGVTTTLLGPAGPCRAGPGQLPAGRQVSNPELAAVPLRRHEWHGECNYTALPAAA